MTGQRHVRGVTSFAATGLALFVMTGCATSNGILPGPDTAPTSSATPSNTPIDPPAYVSEGTAEQNLAVFEWAGSTAAEKQGTTTGDQLIDSLVRAGFARNLLEVTPDVTAAGFEADSIFVSARFGEQCLVGQARGPRFTAIVTPALSNKKCLVGGSNRLG